MSDSSQLSPSSSNTHTASFWNPFVGHNAIDASNTNRSIGHLLEENVQLTPNKTAIETDAGKLTFSELNKKANLVANCLLNFLGEGEHTVCIWQRESTPQVCSVVGIWKAGKTLVASDPSAPPQYNRSVIQEAKPSIILTNKQDEAIAESCSPDDCRILTWEWVMENSKDTNPQISVPEDRVLKLVYTSGSSGVPKAVESSQKHIVAQAITYNNANGCTRDEVILFLSPLTHTNGASLISTTLICGSTLSCYPISKWGVDGMEKWIREKRVTLYLSVPTVFRFFLKTVGAELDLSSVRLVHLGGEPVRTDDVELFKKHFPDSSVMMSNIGSSEAGSIARHYFNKDSVLTNNEVPLGIAYAGKTIEIWDKEEKPLPQGEVGELIVKSEFLANGYRNNPEQTNKVFKSIPGEDRIRIYKTGDMARIREDGCLVFTGRKDQQIKINGHRIEIGEIESTISSHPKVKLCAVKAWPDKKRGVKLVAYIQGFEENPLDETELRNSLTDQLPYVKVPRVLVIMDSLPRLSSGKLDRKSLQEPTPTNKQKIRIQPETEYERTIHSIWVELFGSDDICCDDNFFALGGDSLQATRLLNNIFTLTQKKLPHNFVFQYPSIRTLAKQLENNNDVSSNIIPMAEFGGLAPVFIIHGWAGSLFHWIDFAKMLDLDRPVYGIQGNEFTGKKERHSSVEELADNYADQIIDKYPEGPYHLVGYSLGGVHAFAVAKSLLKKGKIVQKVYIIDTQPRNLPVLIHLRMILPSLANRFLFHLKSLIKNPGNKNLKFVYNRWAALKNKLRTNATPTKTADSKTGYDPGDYYHVMSKNYVPTPSDIEISLFVAEHTKSNINRAWKYLSNNRLRNYSVKGEHMDILNPENLEGFVKEFEQAFSESAQKTLHERFSISTLFQNT